jgi:mRNA interferase RelE/StbE
MTRVEWHDGALRDLQALDHAVQQRITNAVGRLRQIDDARQRLVPYVESLRGYWKPRVGDYRLICELRREGAQVVVVIHVQFKI